MDATVHVTELGAGRGARWLLEAFRIFKRAPLAWIGLCAGWLVITLSLIFVPLPLGIGAVVVNLVQPAFFASFSITAFRQLAGEPITMGDLFSGFRRNLRALVVVGAVLLFAEFAVLLLMVMLGMPVMQGRSPAPTVDEVAELLRGKEWIFLVGAALTAAVKGLLWFAPPLIAFHGMSASQAMRWSVFAAISNLGAMVLYGLTLVTLFFLGLLPWGLGVFIVIPVAAISTFVGYREVFEAERMPLSSE